MASMKDFLQQAWTLSCWTSDDARNAISTTLASAGIGFLIVTNDPDYAVMLRVSAVRSFLPRETILYQLLDLLAYGSAGYASYLVYTYGGGFSNSGTAVALLLYGGVLVQDAGYDLRAPNAAWRTDEEVLQQLFHHYAFRSLTTLALANTYLIIYEEAGCWLLPLAISSLFKMFAFTLFVDAAH